MYAEGVVDIDDCKLSRELLVIALLIIEERRQYVR